MVKLLLEDARVDLLQINDFGCSLSHWSCLVPHSRASASTLSAMLHFLISLRKHVAGHALQRDDPESEGQQIQLQKLDFTLRNHEGHSPLNKAAYMGHKEACIILRNHPQVRESTFFPPSF
jgi:ankyrin repeat protein